MRNKHQSKPLKLPKPYLIGMLFVFPVLLFSVVNLAIQAYSILTAPSQKVKAVVYLKGLEPNLFGNKYSVSLESDKLPYNTVILDVSPMQYAAVSVGDSTCVRFKFTREYPQFKEEFLSPSDCEESK